MNWTGLSSTLPITKPESPDRRRNQENKDGHKGWRQNARRRVWRDDGCRTRRDVDGRIVRRKKSRAFLGAGRVYADMFCKSLARLHLLDDSVALTDCQDLININVGEFFDFLRGGPFPTEG